MKDFRGESHVARECLASRESDARVNAVCARAKFLYESEPSTHRSILSTQNLRKVSERPSRRVSRRAKVSRVARERRASQCGLRSSQFLYESEPSTHRSILCTRNLRKVSERLSRRVSRRERVSRVTRERRASQCGLRSNQIFVRE